MDKAVKITLKAETGNDTIVLSFEEPGPARCLLVAAVNGMYVGVCYTNNRDGKGWLLEHKTGPCGIARIAAKLIDEKYPDLPSASIQPVIVLP